MADTIRLLGQAALVATTLTDIYTVPGATQTVLSTISICNRGGSATTFRISFAINGAADSNEQYLYFDLPIPANDTFVATIGITLDASDVVRAFAGNANLTVQVFGVEIT
jgi:hypothetical protein